jgi:signal transduction histidine kinase
LADALARLQPLVGRLVPGDVDADDLQHVARDHRAVSAYSTLEIADAEDALTLVLEELGVPEPWRLVGSLAAVGISGERARELVASSGPMVLEWLAFLSNSQQASQDLAAATRRVTELVGAMENYAYLDRGAVNDIDVHEGLDATLTVLAPAAESRAVSIRRDYAGDLPRVVGDGAELNQVWTNLIENAVAAASAAGTVTISTRVVDGHVEVDVTDDGPGVDPEIRGRIFDPFFTTRDVGQGIGLGLHTARQIVAEHHHGTLTMSSRPGRTTFRTRLPGASPRLV